MDNHGKITVNIEKLANTGEGIAYYNDRTIFVPFSFPGEEIEISTQNIPKKGIVWGKIEHIKTAHSKRISNNTPYPGSEWQNLDYSQQLNFKEIILKDTLKFFGKFSVDKLPLSPIVPSSDQLQYRNKITLVFSRNGLGIFQPNSSQIINDLNNPLIPKDIQELLNKLNIYFKDKKIPFYLPEKDSGDLRQLILKWNKNFEVLLGIVTRFKTLPKKEEIIQELPGLSTNKLKITGLIQNINKLPRINKLGSKTKLLWGEPYIKESINRKIYAHSLGAFFQVNIDIAKKIQDQLKEWLLPDTSGILFDLYGGLGFFSIALANNFGETIIVEENPEAIEMAMMNRDLNTVSNIKCEQATVESFLNKNKLFPTAVLLDPPRKGCSQEVMEGILKLRPKQVVYISCAPVTLARDLRALTLNNNYTIKEIQPFDMFPQTPHLEIMTLLEKN